jgi:hypothetical protein
MTDRTEAIKAIAKILYAFGQTELPLCNPINDKELAKSILNLPAKCTNPECRKGHVTWLPYGEIDCPRCHGTGLDPERKLLYTREELIEDRKRLLKKIGSISYQNCPHQECYSLFNEEECVPRRLTDSCNWFQNLIVEKTDG